MERLAPATLALHAAKHAKAAGAPLAEPIVNSISFHADPAGAGFSAKDMPADMAPFYARWGGPTVKLLEDRIAALEGAEAAVCFGSGMGAISALFASQLKAGDHLVISNVCYAGVAELAHELAESRHIGVTAVDSADAEAAAAAMNSQTRLVHIETPANPTLRLADIAAIAKAAHAHGAKLSVDSTIATPIGTRPLALGADFVVHSMSKFINGHGDALGGVITGSADDVFVLRKEMLVHHGAVLDASAAARILRGLETLPLRMRQHEANARKVAAYLESCKRVTHVYWPGAPSHPQFELAQRQMANASGVLAFRAVNAFDLARELAAKTQLFSYAVSLGHTRSLIFFIPTEDILETSFDWTDESAVQYRAWAGEGLFRVSVGLEDAEDLIADLRRVLR